MDLNLTIKERQKLSNLIDDLNIKAMLFDMDVDWETLTLVEKRINITPTWLTRWLDKQAESDYTVYDNGN